MHYTGMSGIQRCLPVYNAPGLVTAIVASLALSIVAIWIAYGERSRRNIVLGTISFGFTVFMAHFVAMANTQFMLTEAVETAWRFISNNNLAYIVTFGFFLICCAFLLNTATFAPEPHLDINHVNPLATKGSDDDEMLSNLHHNISTLSMQIPFQKEGKTVFICYDTVAAIRAEGHYTIIYSDNEKLFCPGSLSQV